MQPDHVTKETHHVQRARAWWYGGLGDARDVAVPLALMLIALVGLCGLSGLATAWFGVPVGPTPVMVGGVATATPACQPLPTTEVAVTPGGLQVGSEAVVCDTMGQDLRLNCSPGVQQDEVGRIAEGTRVSLLEGPAGADSFRWWRVSSPEGVTGWALDNWLCLP